MALAFVQTYFLAGLVASANEVLHGRDHQLGAGLRGRVVTRLHRILPWAIVLGDGLCDHPVRSRSASASSARSSAGLLGAAWNVLTFLTVPIIVFEDVGPVNALKRSGTLLKQTWGENIIAQIGLGLIS